MKVVIHSRGRDFDAGSLRSRFQSISFAITNNLAELSDAITDADVLVTPNRPYLADMAKIVNERQKQLRWVAFTTSGIDSAIKSGGFPKGTIVTNSAGLSGPILAEHAFAFFLFLARRFRESQAAMAKREWIRDELTPSMTSLYQKSLLIFGMGATGQAAARIGKAFQMRVTAVSRAYPADGIIDRTFTREQAKDAILGADFILLSMPSTPETRHFVNADLLSAAQSHAILVNVARGDLIDTPALLAALQRSKLGGAGLDVTEQEPLPNDSPLWTAPNLAITPHIAATGADLKQPMIDALSENLRRFVGGQPLKNTLDWEKMI
jgi:phosphoglycerate dehydrogenase-like enzyme